MIRSALTAAGRGLSLFALGFAQLAAFVWTVTALALLPAFAGIFLVPGAVAGMRLVARISRHRARAWSGVDIPEPYAPVPRFKTGLVGQIERCRYVLLDIATYRDLIWSLADPVIGSVLAVLPAALLLYGVEGIVMPVLWENFHPHGFRDWYVGIHVTNRTAAWVCVPLGAVILVAAVRNAERLLGVHARWTRVLLAPMAGLAPEPRPRVSGGQQAELRRIERDLHDGAQARLVAMGMSLDAVEQLLERDPAKARLLLTEARQASATALSELRDLVRGIHPPVLADRGLGAAVQSLAQDSPLDVAVVAELDGRLDPPVEAAAYFAVAEVLANAAKHAAARRVRIRLRHGAGRLHLTVSDDGRGGASVAAGTGLAGVQERLRALGGHLTLDSPPDGPTIVMMELPCELSSARTSSS
ncbi:sensor histidine kinase [Actinomadura macrotermitis]|uniref:histidine kinase n=1 Tax=Actinomadura macrotermitis TaxID=2585200 RepID=A0A7K0C8D2_9ACTN|nr:sensor histidine kinase [Actinomadura macrotermitis]MQY09710.1 hypothetical protein [Actinomadura macrotermitis]